MTIVLQAPGPDIAFGTAPSGSSYISDANGLVVIPGSGPTAVEDELYLLGAGCIGLVPGGFGQNSLQTGTSYTVQPTDDAQEIICTNAGAFTLDLPNGMPVGFHIHATQGGTGTVTANALSGATIAHGSGTAGQYRQIKCVVISNSTGTSAVWDVLQVGT